MRLLHEQPEAQSHSTRCQTMSGSNNGIEASIQLPMRVEESAVIN